MINELFSWLRNNTLTVATFVLAFVSYLQVRASYKQIRETRLMKKIDMHNTDLRRLFQMWHDDVSLIIPFASKFVKINHYLKPMRFERESLFSDLEKHLPAKYEGLMRKWRYCRELIKKYCQLWQENFDKINDLISSDMQKDELNYRFPPESIFFKAIEPIEPLPDKEYYNYKTAEGDYAYSDAYTESKGLFYWTSDGFVYPLTSPNIGFSNEDMKKIIINHKIMSQIFKTDYETNIKNLINVSKELEEKLKELEDTLIKLTNYPEYNNMTCEYIMPETHNWIKKLLQHLR